MSRGKSLDNNLAALQINEKVLKMKRICMILMVLMAIISCDKKSSKTKNQASKKEKITKDNILRISIETVINEDDIIQLFYTDQSEFEDYSSDKRLALPVKGSSTVQTLVFNLPKDVLPYKFRIDLGDNSRMNQTQIDIISITIELNNNNIVVTNELLDSFFQPNIYLEGNETGYERKLLNDRFDPFITSKAILIKKMELEL